MTFGANGSEIPKLFVEVFQKTLDLKFEDYLANEGRGFIAVVVSNENPAGLLAARCRLDEQHASDLFKQVLDLGQMDAFGGYFTPTRFSRSPLGHDVLLVQQRWLALDSKGHTAIAYHEACHCFRDSKGFTPFHSDSTEIKIAGALRGFTKYAFEDEFGHDDQWFALICARARQLQSAYPNLFTSVRDAVVTALTDDINADELKEDAPDLLEAAP